MGIELLWRRAKWLYKAQVDWMKAQNRLWDQMGLVENVMDRITSEFAMR